jgi:hypothetical protein
VLKDDVHQFHKPSRWLYSIGSSDYVQRFAREENVLGKGSGRKADSEDGAKQGKDEESEGFLSSSDDEE